MHVFILPLVSFLISIVWLGLWLFTAIYVFSVGTPTPREGFEFMTEIMWDKPTRWIFLYHLFGLFWINAFIIGCTQFIIGASACIWYYECTSDSKGRGTVGTGFKWLFRYHLGSVAFGSFCIAVCQMIRVLFEYFRRKIGVAEKTKVVKIIICVTGYLLWVMENCVKYITKNAYIQIALTNNSFFKSAWHAYALMIKHAHRYGLGNSVGFIFMLFGCLLIATLNCFGAYVYLTSVEAITSVISEPIAPTVVVGVISIMTGFLFLSIFSFSSDAIFQSFLLDEEMRFAGNSRPDTMQEFATEMKNRGKGCCEGTCF